MRNELKDFPNDGRGLNPQDLANEEVIKPEDRSRSPENWGLYVSGFKFQPPSTDDVFQGPILDSC